MKNVEIYTTPTCPYCIAAKKLLGEKGITYKEIDVSGNPSLRQTMTARANGARTVPQIFIDDMSIGGCDDAYQLEAEGKLDEMLGLATS